MTSLERVANLLLAFVVVVGLIAGVLSLNRTADLAVASVASIGKAEGDAAYARAKTDDMVAQYQDRIRDLDREARLAQYEVDELKMWNVEHGLGLPDSLKKERKK